ncbi:FHA domain-containing protein [Scytonema sp. UIC 10036]|uniref:FHA domain-containing protein n=1 Tax=Scytonema sp. UIC 10036 TaxID=2304196 RepID=UPI0012DA5FB5|nr:FHA domain-containing protein [Scytonema sp. UIC 10036]MUG91550.1 FHA domain-containing protein [Scytonema sp. UIC 10036]
MQNLSTSQTTGLGFELFHVQTNTSFELPPNLAVIRVGKQNEQIAPDINVTFLPDADIVSRLHLEIQLEENTYYITDSGSSNGTFLNELKLEPRKRYPLQVGDKINLGQEEKVTFIFQHKQNLVVPPNAPISKPTVLQPEIVHNTQPTQVDRNSKFVGAGLMLIGILLFAANTQIGIFLRIPTVLMLIVGAVLVLWRRDYRTIGWVLIGLGVAFMIFTGNLFASFNLLAILFASALFAAGYQLFKTGKVLNYSLQSLKGLLKQ